MNEQASKCCGPTGRGRWSIVSLTLLAASTLLCASASAQVVVTATAGDPGPTPYTTLGSAFAAINGGIPQGAITIDITGDTDEGTATAVLNASGTGSASYTSVTISPSGGAARTISGATTAGNPLIDLNGADNVTIDGLNTGGNSLTISNTTASPTSGTSTIRFIGGATNNIVTNSTVLGSFSASVVTNGGNIYFATDALTANGNDNNTISNSNIGPAGTNLPTKGVYGNGSTTTAAIGNNGIVINNNNIFDFFGAAVTSAGVHVAGGCSGWTISNNRFFQTAPRTWTTGANNRAIDVQNSTATTGAQGFGITGNSIGFASSAGTGTYTLTGSTGKFAGIVFNGVTGGAVSDIASNTIASVSLAGVTSSGTSTSSPFMAILVTNGVANTNNNTIGSQTGTGSLTFSTNTTTSTDVYGIYNFSVDNWTANGNAIGSLTASNAAATGTFIVYVMRANTSTAVAFNAASNNVGGTTAGSIQNNSTSTAAQVIGMFSSNARPNYVGNTVRNLAGVGGTGTGSGASVIGISNTGTTTTGNLISQNTIQALSNSNAAAAAWVTGVNYNGATTGTNLVQRNFIHSLSTASTSATATVNGIHVLGGLTTYQNNMVVLGNDMTANSPQINGINETAGTNNLYHNSVYIGGSGVAVGTASSFGFQSTVTTNNRNYRDNIFVNARSNGAATSKHYAIRVGGTAPNPAGLTSNNNVLLASGTGGLTGLFNAVDQPSLVAWQGATGQDANSFALDPQYLAPTATPPDLHINPAVATPIEGNGFLIGSVTDDFDGQARAGLTPTDIGADAGNFIGADLLAPTIAYTPFVNTSLTGNRTLTATVADATGVATGGLSPRIYYRKGAGSYFSQGCILTSGTVNNGTWDCLVNNADMGGVTTGDVISYFVIAQDTLGNIGSNPPGVVAVDVNNVTTPPLAPNTYSIVTAFTGSYDVGAGQTFTSLTNPGGIFAALNAGAFTGNVTINITSDLAGELGTNALNQWAEDGLGGYTLTMKPSGGAWTITGDSTTAVPRALIRLNGADRVTIDGSSSGGTDRSLTISNADVSTASAVILVSSGASGAQSDTLKNLVVIGSANTQTFIGINFGGAGVASLGTDNDNNRVENCDLRRMQFGIASQGASVANKDTGTVITRNVMNATGANSIGRGGIVVSFEDGIQITENTVGGIVSVASNDVFGISLGGLIGWANTTTTGGSEVSNATVTRNSIGSVVQTNTFSAAGIIVTPATTGTNLIANNFISGVLANGTTPDFGAGIFIIDSGVDSATGIYANSVSMTGSLTGGNQHQFALAVNGTDPLLDVRDNILLDTQSTGATTNSYAIGLGYAAFANLTSDFNDLFVTPTGNFRIGRTGSLVPGGAGGTDLATLLDWQTATGKDASSLSEDPLFTSPADLHIQAVSPAIAAGTPLAAVTVDFDNEPRPVTSPDIGGDELVNTADLAITKTDGVTTAIPGGTVTYTITASNAGPDPAPASTVSDTFPASLTCSWTCVGAGGGSCTAGPSAGNINDTVNLPVGASVTYTALCGVSPAATGTLSNTATVAPSGGVGDPSAANNSATDTDTIVATVDVSITKTDGVTTAVPGGSVTYTITAANAGPSAAAGTTVADTFPASLTCTWTCVGAGGGTCTAAGAGNINDTANLPAGGSATYTASCNIAPSAIGNLSNTAGAAVAAGINDIDPGNNLSTDTDTLTPIADVAITKTDGVTTAIPGMGVTYTIVASSIGPSDAPGTMVLDTFPSGLACSWTCVAAGGATCTAGPVVGDIADLILVPPSGTATYTAVCSIPASATGSLSNTVQALINLSISDPNPNNNSATDTDTLQPTGDLGITKTDGVATAAPGSTVTYTIVATNPGPSNSPATSVTDAFPASLTCNWTCVGAGGGTCTASGPGNISDTANLPAGGSATYTAACTIDPFATGTLSNTASLAGGGGFSDPNPGNNSALDQDGLVITSDLSVTKDDGVTVAVPGGTLTYTIVATNQGPSYAQGNVISDQFQADLTCSWTCTPDGSGGTTCTPGPVNGDILDTIAIAPGHSVAYTAVCTVSATATTDITNAVSLTAGPGVTDPILANNSAVDVDVLGQALSIADVTVTEGNSGTTPADFVVSLAAPVSATVTVDFTTVDGSATAANNDYAPLSGTLVFAPGELTKVVSTSVIGDLKFEPDEDYTVVLSNATNATIADGTGLGTILNDDTPTSSSKEELVHDSRETRSLGLTPARDNPTYFRMLQKAHSSYEIVVDATTGDIGASGPALDRMDSDGITVLQSSTSATGGSSRSLRIENATGSDVASQFIRVRSSGCTTDCDPDDTYRIRAYDSTYSISRFNNSATQVTVILVNNPTDRAVAGNLWFWQSSSGTLLASQVVTLPPKATFVLNTSSVAALGGQAGTVTFSNDAPFGALNGKAVAVEPATGFTFDTAMVPRPASTKMVPRDN